MFKGLTGDDVIKFMAGEMYLDGDKLTKELAGAYRDEAIRIKEGRLWRELKKQVTVASNRRMFEKGKGVDDMFFGKAMLYDLDLIDKYLDLFTKVKY